MNDQITLSRKALEELRVPTNAIVAFVEIIHNQSFGPIENKEYLAYLGDIIAAGGHMNTYLDGLLNGEVK